MLLAAVICKVSPGVSASYRERGGNKKNHAFQARPRAKRSLPPSDGNDDEISDVQRSVSTNRAKASTTLY